MQYRKHSRTAEGVLALMALVAAPATSARAMQAQPAAPIAAPVQDAAQPQQTPDMAQPYSSPGDESKSKQKALVVTGTIVKTGSVFVLKDDTGTVYRLDAQDKAAPFENKTVKVTGKLEQAQSENQTAMLHVDAIEAMSA